MEGKVILARNPYEADWRTMIQINAKIEYIAEDPWSQHEKPTSDHETTYGGEPLAW